MTHNKKWIYKEHDDSAVARLQETYLIPRLTAAVLQNRMDAIAPDLEDSGEDFSRRLYDTGLLKNVTAAVERISHAIENREHITIYGDYDADGVTSTAVLYLYLKERGAVVDYYIPDRVGEGYGVNTAALDKIKGNGAGLIITVDTGVTAVAEVEYAKQLGMDVIVTDHHECKSNVPVCHAVIDPKQEDCAYPFSELAGVGVVFKLITALDGGANTEALIEKYMALVCLGTIADVAPLIDENRTIVTLGLRRFAQSGNAGVDALLDAANLRGKPVTAGSIGFIIAPRINAAGRLGRAHKSVELFICGDRARAREIALELSGENQSRQNMEREIFEE
ncbi:MAG: DHH family phosphoesterase, partial [Clostridiales bacterium]|nr:DHH family phosphoesterase [Clostridiales bacterium]